MYAAISRDVLRCAEYVFYIYIWNVMQQIEII